MRERGLVGDAELPVCDGCQCGACATLDGDDAHAPCGKASLHLGSDGRFVAPAEPPHLHDVQVVRVASPSPSAGVVVVDALVEAPAHTPTQPPIFGDDGAGYAEASTYLAVAANADAAPRPYPDLPGVWRLGIAVDPPSGTSWPWRASLASAELASTWNRANVVLPAKPGEIHVRVRVVPPPGAHALSIALLRDGAPHETRTAPLP